MLSIGKRLRSLFYMPVSQEVKMLPFHGGDIGSIPVQAIFLKIKYCEVSK